MRPQTSLAAALIALGGAGVAFADGDRRAGAISGPSNHETVNGLNVVRSVAGGYEIRLSPEFFSQDFNHEGAADPGIGLLRKDQPHPTFLAPATIAASELDTILVQRS